MAKYDDASWHYGGDFPKDLSEKNGATHIGMFLTWCVDNNLISDFQIEESGDDLKNITKRKLTGAEFLMNNCDGKLTDEDLNDTGNNFANDYYEEDSDFSRTFNSYLKDYERIFKILYKETNTKLESFYHIENTWKNYNVLVPVIDIRFAQWKKFEKE